MNLIYYLNSKSYIADLDIYNSLKVKCLNNDLRTLKEGIRFYINMFIVGNHDEIVCSNLADLIEFSLTVFNDEEAFSLALFCLL